MKTLRKIILIAVLILSVTVPVAAYSNVPYTTYTYNYDGTTVESPHAFVPKTVISGHDLGVGELSTPEDMCTDKYGNIYIADTSNARVIVVSADYKTVRVIDKFVCLDKEYALTKPTGLYVTEKGDLYIADSTGINVYIFSASELTCKGVIKKPESGLLPKDFSYIPTKVAADKAGRVYIISAGNTYGVVALNNDGEFSTFVGAQKVTVSVIDKMWRKFMTNEQKKRTLNYVPTNYNNINIDEKGFLYVTSTYSNVSAVINTIKSRSTDNRYAMIKKLNSSGEDVLIRTGAFPPAGDVEIAVGSSGNETNTDIYYGPSSIVDAAIGKDGIYTLADQKRGKIFSYDANGNLLYAFGGTGNQPGLFRKLAAIDYDADGNIVALDNSSGKITVFSPTEYGTIIQKAINLTANRKYDESVEVWREILLENSNFDLANIGIGTAMMREGKYKEAMKYFKLANDVDDYSESYSEYRREKLGNFILVIPIVAVALCWLISFLLKKVKRFNDSTPVRAEKRTFLQEFLYVFQVIFRPFASFWELKRTKRGSVRAATTILALAVFSLLFRGVGLSYIYTGKVINDTNILTSLLVILAVVAVWCISNWCLTSLMYGEGNLKDIYIASCYSLMPIVFFTIPATILSNFVTSNELMFVNFLFTVGYIWTGFLLFCAILSTHNYELGKNVVAVSMTLVGMIIIVFLVLLFVNLISQMFSMASNIYNEITFRM